MLGFGEKLEQIHKIEVTGSGAVTYEIKARNWLAACNKIDDHLNAQGIKGNRKLQAK